MLEDRRCPVVAGDHDIGKRLVVAQKHVEARPQALDQVGFEQQRLGLRPRRDEFHMGGFAHHLGEAVGMDPALRIIADTLLEAARLADVKHVLRIVEHAVDARRVRQVLDEFGDQARRPSAPSRSSSLRSSRSTRRDLGSARPPAHRRRLLPSRHRERRRPAASFRSFRSLRRISASGPWRFESCARQMSPRSAACQNIAPKRPDSLNRGRCRRNSVSAPILKASRGHPLA